MQRVQIDSRTKFKNSPNSDEPKNIKKLKPQKGNGIKKYLKRLVFLLLVFSIIGAGYFLYSRWDRLQKFNQSRDINGTNVKICDNILNPKCWGEALSPKLNQENGVTGVLIVGLDSREEGGVNEGTMNTDSIMAAFYNHQTKKTTLISLPRDLYVPYSIGENGPYYAKINAIYATGEARSDVNDGFDLLEETVENIIGREIQYRVVIRLKGVEDAIDAVGGVTINVPTYLKIQYPNDYPGQNGKPNTQWLYYEFEEGDQLMDGEHALVWSRFRKVVKGDLSYASDFSRAERQQEVLDGLKEKALSEEGSTLEKAQKYWDIFQALNKNIDANIGLEEIFAGLSLADEADKNPINIVLDPNFGGLNQIIYHPPTDETGGYQIRFKDKTFKAAQAYLTLIEQYPKLYDEDAHILIENHLGRAYNNQDIAIAFRDSVQSNELPINSSQLTMVTKSVLEPQGVIIIDFSKGEKWGTTQYLSDYFNASKIIEDPENYGFSVSGYKEDILILITPSL